MKKLMILMFCMIIVIGLVNAAEWDNVLDYENNDMTVKIKNWLGLFGWLGIDDEVGTARLKSHISVNHVKNVEIGETVVMWYEFDFNELYVNGLENISFIDIDTGKKIKKDYSFVSLEKEIYQVPIYENQCNILVNGSSFCKEIIIGEKEKVREKWVDYNSNDIIKGISTIGVKTNIKPLEKIDIIWTVAGKEISKHAIAIGTYQFTYNASTNVDETINTWAGVNFSVADTNRVIVIGTGGRKSAPNAHVVNITIGGINATRAIAGNQGGSAGELWYASVTAGTSGTVIVTWNDTQLRSGIGAWAIYTENAVPFDTDEYNQGTATATLDVPSTGVVIGYEYAGSGLGITWTGLTEDFDQESENSQTSSGAMNSTFPTAVVGHTVTTSRSDLNNDIMVVASWGILADKNPVVSLNSPVNGFNTNLINITFNGTVYDDINLSNVSIFLDDKVNQTNSSGLNNSNYIFTINYIEDGNHNWTYQACDNSSQCTNTTRTFSIADFFEVSATVNNFTFETKTESFIINLTTNGTSPSSAILDYDGINKGSAIIFDSGNNNFNISKTIDIPLGIGNKTWKFNFTLGGMIINSTPHQQRVVPINLTVCQAPPLDIPYLNLTFRNETINQQNITASISGSEWVYYLGTGVVNKTLSYANTTESLNYTFCLSPSNQTMSSTVDISYTNTKSQQRTRSLSFSTLTNTTTTQILYLLPTIKGLFSQFVTQDTLGNTLKEVLAVITRSLGGSTITITSDETDGSGLVVFFLDPDVTYSAVFSKTGFIDNSFTFVPVTDLRTVIMGSTTAVTVNGSTISLGTSYDIEPSNSSLKNNTIITFSFNVTSGETITLISLNITNSTTQRLFQSNAGQGFISGTVNTDNNTKLFGEFIIQTANETIIIKRIWFVGTEFIGDYSLFRQLTLFNDYGFDEFIKFLIVLSVIVGLLIFMSGDNQIEDEIKMAVITLVVWGFSIVNWLNTGFTVTSSSANINALTQFSSQYGIAILTTGIASYFILRRIFRQI